MIMTNMHCPVESVVRIEQFDDLFAQSWTRIIHITFYSSWNSCKEKIVGSESTIRLGQRLIVVKCLTSPLQSLSPFQTYPPSAAFNSTMILSDLNRLVSLKGNGGGRSSRWSNHDITPLPPCRRTWGFWSFVSFWAINNLCPTTFTVGSTLIGIGLSVWQAMIAVIVRVSCAGIQGFTDRARLAGSSYS